MKTTDYPNGITATYDYDALNRLTDLLWENGSSQLYRYHYSLCADGQRAKVTEYNSADAQVAQYVWTYDNLNRLLQEQFTDGANNFTHQYVYDLVGNRLEKNILAGSGYDTSYTYNTLDQMLTEVSNGATISYVYDNNGAMVEKVYGPDLQNDPADVYAYNLQGRLISYTPDTGSAAAYTYDPDGIRTSKTVGAVTTDYLIDPYNPTGYAQVLQSDDGANQMFYYLGADIAGQSLNTGNPVYFLYDGHGSVAHDTNTSGAITESYAYDAYGNLIGGNPADDGLYYTGEMYDAAIDGYNLRSREYTPRTGTFNSRDTFAGSPDNPQSFNKYVYCHGNPTNGVDPSGQEFSAIGITISNVIGASLYAIHSFNVHRAGTRAADRLLSAYSSYLANNVLPESRNATIIVHGVDPHTYGYSSDFISELERRAPDQDYFEYVWSGFTMTNPRLPTYWDINTTHNIAKNGLVNVIRNLKARGYKKVNIISHSWGTVISRDAQYNGVGGINTWVTMGSPLTSTTRRPDPLGFWLNIYCVGDPVVWSGLTLWTTGIQEPGIGYLFNAPKDVVNEQLPLQVAYPGFNFDNHSIYWRDPVALDRIGVQLKLDSQ